MWLSSGLRSAGLATVAFVALVLSACTGLTPVYGPAGDARHLALIYAKPTSRLEQVVYEDLALKLGKATANAPSLSVNVTALTRALTSNKLPATQQEQELTAEIKLTDVNGAVLFSGMRSATADYTSNSQGLATDRAAADAEIRAAHALADTIRLTLLGVLTK